MAELASATPAGYHTINPYLSVKGAKRALDFYRRALGATEVYRLEISDGRIGHAEIQVGDSRIMLADEMPDQADAIVRSPQTLGGTSCGLHVYVRDVDAAFDQAIAAGGVVKRPVQNQFYGERSGTLADPFGHLWTLATPIEQLSVAEIRQRV